MRSHLLILLSVFLFSCGTNKSVYKSPDLKEKTYRHKTIAILPFHIVQTGHVAKNVSQEDIKNNNEKWAFNFQEALHSYALKYTSKNKKAPLVSFQALQKTNAILKEAGFKIEDIYTKQPEEIAALLKVDAVLMTTLEKDKNFSDGVAYGVAAGRTLLNVFTKTGAGEALNVNASDINMNSYLYDAKDSKLLWKTYRQGGASLPSNVDGIVEYYSNWIAKKLPYKS